MAIIYPSIATGDFASTKTANNFSGSQTITGSLFISGSISSSNGTLATLSQVTGAITASTYWVSSSNFLAPTSGINITGHTDTTNPNGTDRTPSGGGITFEYDGAAYKRFPGISYVYGGTNYGTITAATFGSTTTYGGLNIVLSADSHAIGFANSLGASGINDGVRYAEFIGNGNLTTSGQAGLKMIGNKVDQDVLWFSVNGQRLHLGVGTNDYLYSDGTRVRTPGDLYASQTVSGSTGLFTTITASVISASQYVGLNGYATLLSNNFSGSQTISGNLNVTGSSTSINSGYVEIFSPNIDGDVFNGAGLKVNPTILNGPYGAGSDYTRVFIDIYAGSDASGSDSYVDIQNTNNSGSIRIGTVAQIGSTGSIYLGSIPAGEEAWAGARQITIGNMLSGSSTTISGNLTVTGSQTDSKIIIYNGPPQWDGVNPEKLISLSMVASGSTGGDIAIYGWSASLGYAQEIDINGGKEGGVYLSAGPLIQNELGGNYAGYARQYLYLYEDYAGYSQLDIQNVSGAIQIGTLSFPNTTSSIEIGTSELSNIQAGQKNIKIGNTFNNSSTTISGNLTVTGSNTIIRSNTTITGSIRTSGSLAIFGSGSATPLFDVQGSQGQLFSVTDSLSGSLFSVKDISGMPIVEVFSDNTILQGSFSAPSLNTTVKNVLSATGSFVVYAVPTASYDAAFFEYIARSGSNARAGQIMTLWSGSSVNLTETTTTDFGSTSGLTFGSYISGSSMVLTGSATTSGWTIKTIVRSI